MLIAFLEKELLDHLPVIIYKMCFTNHIFNAYVKTGFAIE